MPVRKRKASAVIAALAFLIAAGAGSCNREDVLEEQGRTIGRDKSEGAMREIETRIEINAAPERVWAILTDFPAMPSWNPFIRSIAGPLAEGEGIEVRIEPPGQSSMTFRPVLLAVKSERELRWLGSFVAPGVFDGEHSFLIDRISAQRTRLTQSEKFSGLLAPLIMSGSRLRATRAGFVAMNEALKRRAE